MKKQYFTITISDKLNVIMFVLFIFVTLCYVCHSKCIYVVSIILCKMHLMLNLIYLDNNVYSGATHWEKLLIREHFVFFPKFSRFFSKMGDFSHDFSQCISPKIYGLFIDGTKNHFFRLYH